MLKLRMAFLAAFMVPALLAAPARADTIFDAMAKAYDNNPDLNAARAGLRATDENVTIAKAGWRPQISGFVQNTQTWYDNTGAVFRTGEIDPVTGLAITTDRIKGTTHQRGLTITQQIFDGFQTLNKVRTAESQVFSERARVRAQEIQILLSAAEAYSNIARDQQIVAFRKQNIAFLREQVSAAKVRLDVGDGTVTDVSLAEADLARAQALVAASISQLKQSEAVYVQIVGETPDGIKQASPLGKQLPKTIDSAVATGWRENPQVISTMYAIDAAGFEVKTAEGAMLPGVVVQGQMQSTEGTDGINSLSNYNTSSITARLNVPIYQGGAEYGQIRQAKERLGQQRILLDSVRLQVQQTIVSAMAQYDGAVAMTTANRAQLKAANDALAGVIEERAAGQATQLDVLTAQAGVLNAKEGLAVSQRDAVVASFSVVAAMGQLTVSNQNLQVVEYRPEEHYNKVKDAWFGLRTVDGR